MDKKKVFNISWYGLFIILFIIFVVGIIDTEPSGRSPFMEDYRTMLVITTLIFLAGVHVIYFQEQFLDYFLKTFIKRSGIRRRYILRAFTIIFRVMIILVGFFFIVFALICATLLIWTVK